jgi:branched-chain amino acid transport system ATP-binding protein
MSTGLLEVENLSKDFGATRAIDELSISLPRGDVTSIIGPNGAGKTTLFNLLTGELEPTSGEIRFEGERVDDRSPAELARIGISRSYQINNFFPDLTVLENVLIAAQSEDAGFGPADFLSSRAASAAARERAAEIIETVGLTDVTDQEASLLSHGQKRHLEVALALALDPELLLLDEPTAGMSPDTTAAMKDLLGRLSTEYTIVVVEHDMEMVMEISDRVIVINRGKLVASGSPTDVKEDEAVQRIYLEGTAA